MYSALLVDDEIFAVKGMISGVDWERLGISDVYEAYHAAAAKDILLRAPVDVMICDIEMPDESGLELAAWVKAHKPDVVVLFLTCHADFSFAQKAIHLGSYEYLLKPVLYSELEHVLQGALDSIQERREQKEIAEHLRKYQVMWEHKKAVLIERFWQEILSQRLLLNEATLRSALQEYQLSIELHSEVILILISVEKWDKHLSARDEEIMSFALRNAAEEMLVGASGGHTVEDNRGNMIVMLFSERADSAYESGLEDACAAYLKACRHYLFCQISCYISEPVPLGELMKAYHSLLEWEHKNVVQQNRVLFYRDYRNRPGQGMENVSLMDWADWFERGEREKLYELVEQQMAAFSAKQVTVESLEAFYHGFLQVVYYVLQRKGLPAQLLYMDGAMSSDLPAVTKSITGLEQWMKTMIGTVIGLLFSKRTPNSIVQKIKDYIAGHLDADITREDLAEFVYLNPAYISRLFKAETKLSLSDYILQARMRRAAQLLLESDQPVSQIAINLGYGNFSYFARMFKRVYGMTPQEYRKG
ncbi:helix-turn-helix domain-containing protein [Paenibacillus chartarius]|uniref:Helix-turn-helix domain-containing protein n=1 Tax=Paenibacillus chartarius TaxID=747481 RepID=A0ABV6DJC0_9BACL